MITWKQEINSGGGFLGLLETPWSFEETVARLITLSKQDPLSKSDHYKTSVEFEGEFNGFSFALYDYKCDREIHIGGDHPFPINSFNEELIAELSTVSPTPFKATEYYINETDYGWSNFDVER